MNIVTAFEGRIKMNKQPVFYVSAVDRFVAALNYSINTFSSSMKAIRCAHYGIMRYSLLA